MADRHTLFVCRDVSVYTIPPAPTGRGHRAADWRTDALVFRGRLVVEAAGDDAEVRLLDTTNGDLFAVAPVPHGGRAAAVEPALDSSRNFALRLVDGGTGRAAVVGLSFRERGDAFDFNVALADHETRVARAREGGGGGMAPASAGGAAASAAPGGGGTAAPAAPPSGAFALKAGQTITVKKPAVASTTGGGLLARAGGAGGAVALPPPPVDPFSAAAVAAAAVAPAATTPFAPPPPPPPPPAADPFAPSDAGARGGGGGGGGGDGGWATFD